MRNFPKSGNSVTHTHSVMHFSLKRTLILTATDISIMVHFPFYMWKTRVELALCPPSPSQGHVTNRGRAVGVFVCSQLRDLRWAAALIHTCRPRNTANTAARAQNMCSKTLKNDFQSKLYKKIQSQPFYFKTACLIQCVT